MIPVNRPKKIKHTEKYLHECVSSNWFSSEGPFVRRFEEAFAQYLGVSFATSTNSGTTALHLALLALQIQPGDEIILPASTIASCYFAIWYTGAKAVPVDVDPTTYTINPSLIEKNITKKTKAIMVVHLFGHPCDMDPIIKIAKKHHLFIIEDAAEAHGTEYKGKKAGSIGDIGIFSFYANKIVSTGEGGMLVTNNPLIYKKAQNIKNLNHANIRFTHEGIGYKYVMSNLQAAVGLASLEEIESSVRFKRNMAALYHRHLKTIPGIILPKEMPWAKNTYWMYAVRINAPLFGIGRDRLMEILSEKYKIQTRSFFYPPNVAFKKLKFFQHKHFPVAEQIGKDGLYVPSGLGNTHHEFICVCNAIQKTCDEETKGLRKMKKTTYK